MSFIFKVLWLACQCLFAMIVLMILMMVFIGFVKTIAAMVRTPLPNKKRKDENNESSDKTE